MNMHFLSSLIDLFVWSLLGILIGRKMYYVELNKRFRSITTPIIYMLVSLISGLIAVLLYGLPEYGFALNNSIFVLLITFVFALLNSKKFRLIILGFIKLPRIYSLSNNNYKIKKKSHRYKGLKLLNL